MTKSRTNKKKSVIAERLKELRTNRDTIAKDFTQRELAKKIFISYSKICDLENGKRQPSAEDLKIYSKFFNVPTDYILGIISDKEYSNMGTSKKYNVTKEELESLHKLKSENEEYVPIILKFLSKENYSITKEILDCMLEYKNAYKNRVIDVIGKSAEIYADLTHQKFNDLRIESLTNEAYFELLSKLHKYNKPLDDKMIIQKCKIQDYICGTLLTLVDENNMENRRHLWHTFNHASTKTV